jgi:hypothetical protein
MTAPRWQVVAWRAFSGLMALGESAPALHF